MPSPWDEPFEDLVRAALPHLPPGSGIAPDTSLRDAGLDSVGTIELLISLEDHYDVSFPDEKLTGTTFSTAGSLWSTLQSVTSAAVR